MKTVLKFLHYFIKMNTYIFFITVIYFIQKFITKLIFGFENIFIEILYILISVIIVIKYFHIESPYKQYL